MFYITGGKLQMKKITLTTSLLFSMTLTAQDFTSSHFDQSKEHEHVFSPEEEEQYLMNLKRGGELRAFGFRFAQTHWQECVDDPTGNYSGISCASRRGISVILKDFMEEFMYSCIDEGLRAQGGGVAADLHITHDGILGDPRHSPRSLHAEARAIDIRSFEVTLEDGGTRFFEYASSANRPFYRAFRSCWGRVVNRQNGCPLIDGNAERTGSIGWEDANHQRHMHTSVPYCVNGRYGSGYFQR